MVNASTLVQFVLSMGCVNRLVRFCLNNVFKVVKLLKKKNVTLLKFTYQKIRVVNVLLSYVGS